MRCAMQDCMKTKDINPSNRLCPGCEKTVFASSRRSDNLGRQTQARSNTFDQQRDLNVSLSPPAPTAPPSVPTPGHPSMAPPVNNGINFPNLSGQSTPMNTSPSPPVVDMPSLQQSYSDMVANGSHPKILIDMFGMMLNVVSKQSENDQLKVEVRSNSNRIQELENKIGGPDEISEKLGLLISNLPVPGFGVSELDNVRAALSEVKAPGVDTLRDVVKAVRFGQTDTYHGSVKVELRDDSSRASIMKNKKFLQTHNNPIMRNLFIKNLQTEDRMTIQNFARDLLKMLPGGNDVYMAANGHLRQKTYHTQSQGGYTPHHRPHNPAPQFGPGGAVHGPRPGPLHQQRQPAPTLPQVRAPAQTHAPSGPGVQPGQAIPTQPAQAHHGQSFPAQQRYSHPQQSAPPSQIFLNPSPYSQAPFPPVYYPPPPPHYQFQYTAPTTAVSAQPTVSLIDMNDPLSAIPTLLTNNPEQQQQRQAAPRGEQGAGTAEVRGEEHGQ